MEAPRLLEVESQIVGATVYSDLAHVTRRAVAPLIHGASRLALSGLPASVDPGRVRVRTNLGLVRAVEVERLRRPPPSTTGSTQTPLELLAEEVYRLRGERAALEEELALIDALSPNAEAQRGPLKPDVFIAGLEVLLERRGRTLAAFRALEVELDKKERAWSEEQRRLGHQGHTPDRVRAESALVVTVDAEEAGQAELELTYAIGWATWRPYYQLRLDRAAQRIELTRLADVWQETGEDWNGVALALSTAEPEAGLVAPKVRPWRLEKRNRFEDQARNLYAQDAAKKRSKEDAEGGLERRRSAKPMAPPAAAPSASMPPPAPKLARGMAASLFSRSQEPEREKSYAEDTDDLEVSDVDDDVDEDGAFDEHTPVAEIGAWDAASLPQAAPKAAAYRLEVEVDEPPPEPEPTPEPLPRPGGPLPRDTSGGLDFELAVAGRPQQPSGQGPQRLPLGTTSYAAKIEYLLRPVIRDHAFGRVVVVHASEQPLLAGPTALYLKEGYLGETKIDTTPPGGKLILDLGAETQIKCARRSRTSMKTSGLINKDDLHLVEVEIDLENFLDTPAELEVQDQVPVSIDNKVKVKLLRTTPKDAHLDEQTGIITFRVRLAPGGRVELGLAYEIEVPKDTRLIQTLV